MYTQKKTHVCIINDMVSIGGEEWDKLGQTQKAKKATKEKKYKKKELIVVVGIIEASSSAGAKLVSPKFLLGYYPSLLTPHSCVQMANNS